MSGWRTLACALLALVLPLAGCDAWQEYRAKRAWEETMEVRRARDYPALWASLARESKADVERTLAHVRRDPDYQRTMQEKFQLSAGQLLQMDARAFFLALMASVDRNLPTVAALQQRNATGATYLRTALEGDRAVVYWRSGLGREEQTFFAREDGRWKPVLQRN